MDSLHRRLERSKQMQTVLRAFEARDRNLLEDNLWRVSFWSCASVLVMLGVALTQVGVAPPRHAADSHQTGGIDSQETICSPAGLHCPETVRRQAEGLYLDGMFRQRKRGCKRNLESSIISLDPFSSLIQYRKTPNPTSNQARRDPTYLIQRLMSIVNHKAIRNHALCRPNSRLGRSRESFVIKG